MRTSARFLPLVLFLAACAGGKDISEPDVGGGYSDTSKERIPVLTFEQNLTADPALANVSVVLPRPYLNRLWPQSGGTPAHAVNHLYLPEKLKRAWRTDIGEGSDIISRLMMEPVVGDGRIYVIDTRGQVSALDIENGRRIWIRRLEQKGEKKALAFGGGLALDGGRLYVATGYGFLAALDAATGEEIWRTTGNVPLRGAPTVADGRVFTLTQDNQIIVYSAASGELTWTQAGLPEDAGLLGAASPAVEGDTVVAGLSSGELIAMRVDNGRNVWQDTLSRTRRLTPLATLADIDGNPVISRSRVYAAGHAGRMVSIDMRSGERVWESNVPSVHTPWIAGDYLFLLSVDAEITAISAADGRVRWVTQLQRFVDPEDRDKPLAWTGPVLAGDRLIIASSHGFLLSISPYTGEFLGAERLPAGVLASPIVSNGMLFVLTEDADLIAWR
ncbi:MAG: outer membrane protein assembly factor BamB [Rhodothalassiaceae bacterium]